MSYESLKDIHIYSPQISSNSISPDGRSFLPFIMDKVIRPPLVCLVSDRKHLIRFATVLTYIVRAQLVRYNNCRSDLLPDSSQTALTTTVVWARQHFIVTTQATTVQHYILDVE